MPSVDLDFDHAILIKVEDSKYTKLSRLQSLGAWPLKQTMPAARKNSLYTNWECRLNAMPKSLCTTDASLLIEAGWHGRRETLNSSSILCDASGVRSGTVSINCRYWCVASKRSWNEATLCRWQPLTFSFPTDPRKNYNREWERWCIWPVDQFRSWWAAHE